VIVVKQREEQARERERKRDREGGCFMTRERER